MGTQGLATEADSWFTDLIMPVYNRTARNIVATASWGGGGGYDITLDKIWLPSIKEVFGTNNNNIAEGAQFDYFLNVATTAAQRIQRDEGGVARHVWLRSPYTGNVTRCNISTSGASAPTRAPLIRAPARHVHRLASSEIEAIAAASGGGAKMKDISQYIDFTQNEGRYPKRSVRSLINLPFLEGTRGTREFT